MLKPVYTNKFLKEYEKAIKRGIPIGEIDEILTKISKQEKLPPKHRDHMLSGNYADRRECHIKNDYLLIYKIEPGKVFFERLGTHSDLFK